jgi:hypothetical protein
MASNNALVRFIQGHDWRITFGIVVTLLWIGVGGWYVLSVARATPDGELTLDVIGNFLEGAFAPLAFLWLVIGLFVQQKELAKNSEALRATSEQSEKQTLAIAATEMNARQETFFKIKENVYSQLGGITGMLYSSSQGPAGDGEMSLEQQDEYFAQVAAGDCEVFARLFLTLQMLRNGDMDDLFCGTELRERHCRNYMRTFERLCRLAKNCDVDGIIEDSLMQNAFGLLYRRMQKVIPAKEDTAGIPPR